MLILADPLAQFVPVHLRHLDVAENKVRRVALCEGKPLFPIAGDLHPVPCPGEDAFKLKALRGLVLHDQKSIFVRTVYHKNYSPWFGAVNAELVAIPLSTDPLSIAASASI